MHARVESVNAHDGRRPLDRLAAGFLILLLAAGSLVLWIGIPAGGLWAFSKLTNSSNDHFLLSLVFIGVHVLAVWVDPFMRFGWRDIVVPFATSYRPLWIAAGIVGTLTVDGGTGSTGGTV